MGRGKEQEYVKGGKEAASKARKMKPKGSNAKAKAASDKRKNPEPTTNDRGAGSSYAYAVADAMDKSKEVKGSDSGFLGKQKVLLNPRDQVNRQLLYQGKGKKLVQGE